MVKCVQTLKIRFLTDIILKMSKKDKIEAVEIFSERAVAVIVFTN